MHLMMHSAGSIAGTMRYEAVLIKGLRCADSCWGVWDKHEKKHKRSFSGGLWHTNRDSARRQAALDNATRPQHVVRPVDWKPIGKSLEIDVTKPCAWAIWDWHEEAYCGKIWYKTEKSAQNAADMFNGSNP